MYEVFVEIYDTFDRVFRWVFVRRYENYTDVQRYSLTAAAKGYKVKSEHVV